MSQGKALVVLCGIVIVALIWTKPHYGPFQAAQNDDVTFVSEDDPIMQAAFNKARDTLDEFLILSAAPTPNTESFAVKVAISEGDRKEYFWISPFSAHDGKFSGRISNTPRHVSNVSEGQEIQFGRADIVDWSYENSVEKRMYGNFTACALLARESEQEAAMVKQEYGLECEGR
jgi:uncharacterized protein YegJ (DUF2314 family)